MGAVFEVPGWKEFTERCQGVVDKFEEKKLVLMNKMANICLSEISPLIPVDTSRLVSSFQVGVVTPCSFWSIWAVRLSSRSCSR